MSERTASGGAAQRERYHHGDLRRALLDAARHLLETGAPRGVTLRAAAQAAGVSAAAPYRHFKDREALLAAVMTEGFIELAEATELARDEAPDPVSAYLAIGHAYLGFAVANPRLYRLMFGVECNKPGHPDLLAAEQRAFGVVMQAARDCAAAGVIGTRAPEHVALAGWTIVHGLATLHVDGALGVVLPMTLPDAAEALFSILIEGVEPR